MSSLTDNTAKFLHDVELEIAFARQKFPSSNLSMVALMEEVGELAQACLKTAAGHWDKRDIYNEAVQVAAMACRVAVEGDASIKDYVEPA